MLGIGQCVPKGIRLFGSIHQRLPSVAGQGLVESISCAATLSLFRRSSQLSNARLRVWQVQRLQRKTVIRAENREEQMPCPNRITSRSLSLIPRTTKHGAEPVRIVRWHSTQYSTPSLPWRIRARFRFLPPVLTFVGELAINGSSQFRFWYVARDSLTIHEDGWGSFNAETLPLFDRALNQDVALSREATPKRFFSDAAAH